MNAKTQIQKDLEMTSDQNGSWHVPASPVTFPIRRAQHLSKAARPLLSDEQQLNFIKQIQMGDIRSLRKMIAHNMHLVVDLVRPHTDRGLPLLDLVKEGIEGLTYALKHFEPGGDSSFSNYATWCIYHSIERATLDMKNAAASTSAATASIGNSTARNGGNDDYSA